MDSTAKTWLLFFKIFGFTDQHNIDKALPMEYLQTNPEHPLMRRLLYLYSMESPLPFIIKTASVN